MKSKLLILFLSAGFLFLNSCDKEETSSVDLTAKITASDLTPIIGTNITFTIVARNVGPDNATGVDVTNNLPTGYTLVSNSATVGTYTDLAWTIGALSSGASETLTLVYKVLPAGTYPYAVSILGSQADPSTLNNSSFATVMPKPALAAKVTYNADIKPIFVVNCTPCHLEGGGNPNKWDQYAQAKAKISAIIERVSLAQGASGMMPKGGTRLSEANIALLNKWVTDGMLEN